MEKLTPFTPEELQLMLSGEQVPQWSREDIISYTEPKFGYTREAPGFQRFVNVLMNMNGDERKVWKQNSLPFLSHSNTVIFLLCGRLGIQLYKHFLQLRNGGRSRWRSEAGGGTVIETELCTMQPPPPPSAAALLGKEIMGSCTAVVDVVTSPLIWGKWFENSG